MTLLDTDHRPILHVMHADKFVAPFIDFVEQHFVDFSEHQFFIFGDEARFPVRKRANISLRSDFDQVLSAYLGLAYQMNRAEKIILHGLFNKRVVQLLCIQPWLLAKCHWVIWGGDLYSYQLADQDWEWHIQEIFRRFAIHRFGHLVTATKGDADLARRWYKATGQYHDCFMYTSNLYKDYSIATRADPTIHIQIGNSADQDNEHFEMLQMLECYKDDDVRIYAPLSYGDPNHGLRVSEAGTSIFGEKFVALTSFMPLDKYLDFLSKIDVAIFNHRRQQAMGNIVTLLGMGKKVYLRSGVTTWGLLEKSGARAYDSAYLNLDPIDGTTKILNRHAVRKYFSEHTLVDQLTCLFDFPACN